MRTSLRNPPFPPLIKGGGGDFWKGRIKELHLLVSDSAVL